MENRDLNQQVNDNRGEEMNPEVRQPGPVENGKNRFWSGVLAGALVTAFVGLIVVGMSAGIYLFGRRVIQFQPSPQSGSNGAVSITDGKEQGPAGLDYDKITAKMNEIQNTVDELFLYDEDAGNVEEFIYRGMMAGLDDPYSVYYSITDFQSMMDTTNGEYSGIGAMISQNRTTGLCTIVKVFEGSPALEAGMQPGDVIYKVGDTLVAAESLDVLVNNYIKGKEGTPVNITVYREDKDQYVDLVMKRRRIEVPTVEHRMLEDQIGYAAISEFDMITVGQFKAAVDELTESGMKGLIIDLRNNPGGILDGAVEMADYLLPDDISRYDKGNGKTLLVYTADKKEKGKVFVSEDKHQVDLPVVILINGDSASASEVFTGAMKDYNRATVVGTTSYGKGIVQNLIKLGDGSAIKLTTAHYYTPSGYDLHEKGIVPDVEVELREELKTQAVVKPEEDNQLQKAVEVMMEKIK